MFNDKKLCVLRMDIFNNLYTRNNICLYELCSYLIKDYDKYNKSKTYYECQEVTYLLENDTCISKEIIERVQNYFKDETTNKYISRSIKKHCISCKLGTQCIEFKEGFALNNNKGSDNDDNDEKKEDFLKGAIIGIAFVVLSLLFLVALVKQ